jgi:hypothetical protein
LGKDYWLLVPVAGPSVAAQIAQPDSSARSPSEPPDYSGWSNKTVTSLALIDGIVQAAGGGLILAGLVKKERILVPDHASPVRVSLAPPARGRGVGLVGRF